MVPGAQQESQELAVGGQGGNEGHKRDGFSQRFHLSTLQSEESTATAGSVCSGVSQSLWGCPHPFSSDPAPFRHPGALLSPCLGHSKGAQEAGSDHLCESSSRAVIKAGSSVLLLADISPHKGLLSLPSLHWESLSHGV